MNNNKFTKKIILDFFYFKLFIQSLRPKINKIITIIKNNKIKTITGLGTMSLIYYITQNPGGKRSFDFWSSVGPIYLQYRYIQFLNEDIRTMDDFEANIKYNELHNRYTHDIKHTTYRLRGFYLKSAQLMSIQDNFIPKQYMTWLKDTQDNVPSEFDNPQSVRDYVSKILETELNKTFDEVFEEFDDNPLGVASIGQVHKAKLRDTHQVVAVKIQLPDMERRFRADIATLKTFCKIASPQFLPSFREIEKQFCTEFDYRGEAQNLNDIRNTMLTTWDHEVVVPQPINKLCSKHLLVMEYLNGVKLVDGIRAQYRALAAQSGDTRPYEEIEKEKIEAISNGTVQLKTLEAAQKEHEYIEWMIFLNNWVFSLNPLRYAYNQTISPICHYLFDDLTSDSSNDNSNNTINKWNLNYQFLLPTNNNLDNNIDNNLKLVDLSHVLKVLCQVHASQIFEGGTFNGDPHPGNILLMPDGRLGLIDYGQVKRMTLEQRISFAKLIIALYRDDREEIIRIYQKEMGYLSFSNNEEMTYRHACFYCDRDSDDITDGKNMHLFLEWLQNQDPVLKLPEEYIMASRVTLMMRGMAKAFGLQIRVSQLWKDEAEKFLLKNGINY